MNTYELTIVLPEKTTSAKQKAAVEKIESLLKVFKGKVLKSDDWGEIELSYIIRKNKTGRFLYFDIELEADKVKDFNQKLQLDEQIIRHLIVRTDN